jgi:iron complex outermembrane recepter protein
MLVALALLACSFAHAAEKQPLFNIAPGPLQPALERLAAQSGLQLLYDPALLEGHVTHGLAGSMAPQAALAKLLADTDIAFNFTADDAVALFSKSKPLLIPAADDHDRPRTITISTNRSIADLYNSEMNVTATKVDESFLNIPLASESVTAGVLRDLQVNRLEDALQYVSGAEIAPNGQSALGFVLRGFPTYQYYLDGVRVSPDLHHDAFRDFADVERIDVVKGPASLLYGRTEPGGAINVITKQPLADPFLSVEQQGGNFGYERTEIDAGGPVLGNASLLYRFNGAYEDESSFRDIPGNHRIFFAPVVTWNASRATSTTLYGEFLDSHDVHDSGLPIVGNQLPPVPMERSLEVGGEIHTRDYRVGIKGSHVFADGWILRHHFDARWISTPQTPQAALSDDGLNAANCTTGSCPVNRELVSMPESRGHTYFASVDALRDFSIWIIRDSLLVGTDYFSSRAASRLIFRNDASLATDLLQPSSAQINWSLLQDPDSSVLSETHEDWVGVYIQNQFQIGDSLHLLIGGRFDEVHERINRDGMEKVPQVPFGPGADSTFNYGQLDNLTAFKGRAGLLWHPLQTLSAYVNYSQNFGVTAGLFAGDGNVRLLLPAEQSQEWETGLKVESPHGRMAATFAWFDLIKRNIATPVLSPALDNSSIGFVMNGAHNTGLEADFRGELTSGLQLLASYAYIQSRIENYQGQWADGPPKNAELVGDLGARMEGVPRHGGSLWASYHVDGGALRGLKLGFGSVARGNREGDNLNDYQLPAFVKFSALAAYGWRAVDTNFEVQLNVDNLFDRRYFESLSGTRTVMPGTPRRFIATVRASF